MDFILTTNCEFLLVHFQFRGTESIKNASFGVIPAKNDKKCIKIDTKRECVPFWDQWSRGPTDSDTLIVEFRNYKCLHNPHYSF